jgi:tetratricopeptide (TPR) repeat protein
LLYLRGKYDIAKNYLQRAYAIAQKHQNNQAMAEVLNNEGLVAFYQADYKAAITFFEEAIGLWRMLGYQEGLGSSLSNMGQVYYAMGQYAAARNYYEQALDIHRIIGDRAGEAAARHGLGKIARSLGQFEQARSLFEQALTFFQTIGDHNLEARVMYDLGFLYGRLEDFETAFVFLEEAVILLKELHAPWWTLVEASSYLGWTLQNAGRLQEAKACITEALEIERDTQQKVVMVEDMMLLGRVALALNELDLADACAQHVLYFIEDQGILGVEHPEMVYLTCFQIFNAKQKSEQAQSLLIQGQQYVAAQSAQIENPALREAYLTNIPENKELQALTAIPA